MKFLINLVFASLLSIGLFGQSEKEVKQRDQIMEAESYFYYEEYSDALPLFLKLKKQFPDNYNFLYKIGVCYLNIPYEKDNAIPYLEKAVQSTTSKYKPDNVNETQAPLEAMFYLGNAYRVNNRFDDALKAYRKFKDMVSDKVYNTELVDQQIACVEAYYALAKRPIFFDIENMGDRINTKFSEFNAVVTPNEDIMVYNQKQQFYDALMFTVKLNGKWLPPINIIPELGVDGDVYATSISADGTELYLYRSDEFDGNIYVSKYRRGKWTPIKKLNENINTKYWESHASISYDGKTLYFTSNRKGGYGGLDIYKANRYNGDNWVNVQNLGPAINTKYNEESPFICEDGKNLYFSSYGHYNMGGYDVFYSTLLDDKTWAAPLNVGYPVNTADDDIFFQPIKNGQFAYISRYYPGNEGKNDIYRVEIYSGQNPRKFRIKLMAGTKDLQKVPNEITVKIVNRDTRDTIVIMKLDPSKAKGEQKILAGNYQVIFEGKDFIRKIENLTLENNQANSEVQVTANLEPLTKEIIEKAAPSATPVQQVIAPIVFAKSFIKQYGAGIVTIEMTLVPKTALTATIFKDGVQIGKENINVDKKDLIYKLNVDSGLYNVKFEARLPDGSQQAGEVTIVVTATSNAVVAKLSDEQRQMLTDYISTLQQMASGGLLKVLKEVDLDKDGISSVNDLVMYLKSKGQYNNYTPADVDKLINACNLMLANAAQSMYKALKEVGDANVQKLLQAPVSLSSPAALVNSLLVLSTGNAASQSSLFMAMSQLADPGSLYYALKTLEKYADNDLAQYLRAFNPSKHGITNASGLYDYLFNELNQPPFRRAGLIKAFNLAYAPTIIDPSAYLSALIDASNSSEIETALKKLEINTSDFKNASELQSYLLVNAERLKLDVGSLALTMINAKDLPAYIAVRKGFMEHSSVKLNIFLTKLDFDKNNITDIMSFATFLDANVQKGKYTQAELIKIMALSANKQLNDFNNRPTIEIPAEKRFGWKTYTIFTSGLVLLFFLFFFIILARKRKKKKA